MSVVEAMQLGLVPIVTPVGEIDNYCIHRENALIVGSNEEIVDEISALISDDDRYQVLRANAVATWADQQLYADSILQACKDVLSDKPDITKPLR